MLIMIDLWVFCSVFCLSMAAAQRVNRFLEYREVIQAGVTRLV